jgi:hypothetical protein
LRERRLREGMEMDARTEAEAAGRRELVDVDPVQADAAATTIDNVFMSPLSSSSSSPTQPSPPPS